MLFIIDIAMHILWNIKHSKFSTGAYGIIEKRTFWKENIALPVIN